MTPSTVAIMKLIKITYTQESVTSGHKISARENFKFRGRDASNRQTK